MVKELALYYAEERKWRVLPLHNPIDERTCSCGEETCTKRIGKHPRIKNWESRASNDVDIILNWFKSWPDMNIGIQTGKESGIIAIDVDSLIGKRTIMSMDHELPYTTVAKSGEGLHYILEHPGIYVKTKSHVLPGVDSRGDGGYFCAAPSLHKRGYRYEWIQITDVIAKTPQWWIDLLGESDRVDVDITKEIKIENPSFSHYGTRVLEQELAILYSTPSGVGKRNSQLNNCAYKIYQRVAAGCIEDEFAYKCLVDGAKAIGMDSIEAERTIKSGRRGGLKNPKFPQETKQYDPKKW